MILNPVRAVRCALIRRHIDKQLAARKAARLAGRAYVCAHTRKVK